MPDLLSMAPLDRALLSLEGLSTGDAFGESHFFLSGAQRETPTLAPPPWPVTDDTLMAIDIVEVLATHGSVPEAPLAQRFLRSYDPARGYGPAMHSLFRRLAPTQGAAWQTESRALFGGSGSFGNGSAMRIAPLGAFFAADIPGLLHAAAASASVTHAHPEATAGAIAVALAAALAVQTSADPDPPSPAAFLSAVRDGTPASEVRDGIDHALALPADTSPRRAAALLGSGARTSCPDTVPFTLWSAATSLASYEHAITRTASGAGDMDTTCAIVGGIVVLRSGLPGIPAAWHQRREPLAPLLTPPLREALACLQSSPHPPR